MIIKDILIAVLIFQSGNLQASLFKGKYLINNNERKVSVNVIGMPVIKVLRNRESITSDFKNFRYQAGLIKKNKNKIFCGAAVLARRVLLTAAHCTFKLNPNDLTVRVGSTDPTHGGQVINVFKYINYPTYADTQKNGHVSLARGDISILILQDKIQEQFYFPVSLPKTEINPNAEKYIVSGWGHDKGTSQSNLTYTTVNILPKDECIDETRICARSKYIGQGHCFGDSGGPLVLHANNSTVKGQRKRFTLFGTVAGRQGHCAKTKTKYIFTNVFAYVNWIRNIIAKERREFLERSTY